MTIAACYLSSEGVVFGADSTSTMFVSGPGLAPGGTEHHFNYAQKIFEIGETSRLAITMWGLGNLERTSYRTLISRFANDLKSVPAANMAETAQRWGAFFWGAYSTEFAPVLQRARQLAGQAQRTPNEESELTALQQSFSGGFCLGGCCLPDAVPEAF